MHEESRVFDTFDIVDALNSEAQKDALRERSFWYIWHCWRYKQRGSDKLVFFVKEQHVSWVLSSWRIGTPWPFRGAPFACFLEMPPQCPVVHASMQRASWKTCVSTFRQQLVLVDVNSRFSVTTNRRGNFSSHGGAWRLGIFNSIYYHLLIMLRQQNST